jgi:threonine dehydrogenase-like Zn-dependent dehydrogenase
VLVLGAGSIGLLSVLAARFLGAGEVLVTARHPHQAELARSFGASRVLGEAEATEEALDALGRSEPVDVVVETVGGHADTLRSAAAAVRPGGVVSVLGVFWSAIRLNPFPLLLKEVTLAWSYCYTHSEETADFADAVELLDAERARAARLATHAVPLDDVERAFTLAGDKQAGVVKVSVTP